MTGLPVVMKDRQYVTRPEVLGYPQAGDRTAKLEGAALGGGGGALGAAPRLFLREEE